ncbi:MAG: DEAD/DEAH box helicase, partial [Burkholderiales bacterium]
MNNVFGFRDQLISAYSSFSRSFSRIAAPDIRDEVERQYADGRYWPEPLVQINPNYQRKGTVQQLVAEGVLHRACADLFQVGKAEGAPQPLHLYAHQMQALAKGQGKQSYVVTTGTGSGKSLSFFIPVIDRILKAKTQDKTARTRAVVIYPMNALANSQLEELDKFLYGYPAGQQPFTVARYTGQESKAERDAIANNPPDILLTNFMMLELILTRFDEVDRRVVDHCQGLEFLILDELHTYRGRQGADVALLVRRLRERLQASELVCIGTSATMSSTGSLADRNKTVAEVASKLFGAGITEQDIIGETLERVTDPLKDVAAVQANLAGAVVRTQFTWADFEAFRIDPLSIWVELNLGIELPDNEPPRRAKPMTIQAASEKLAKDAGCEIDAARLALKQFLVAAHEIRTPQGRPPFAFKLHQFISGPGKVLATLEAQGIRHVTLDAQRFAPGRQDEGAQLYPVHFCRDCGQEYLPVWQSKRAPTTYTPREIDDITADDNEDVHYGFLCLATSNLPYRGDIEDLPETWLDPSRDQPKIKQNYKKAVPYSVIVDVQGNEGCGESFWYIPGKFRFCLNCGQLHEVHGFDDHWQALRIVFKGLSEGESHLDLPALGGLFATSQCPALDAASLDNAHLLAAIQNLRWASHKGVLAPVDYRNMGPEELGSVYESLLELVPEIDLPARKFGFVGLTSEGSTAGNARKLSGSYYTPDSLVQELIKSALDPVIEQRIAAQPESPVEALLAIRVIDPACGSGHFLLAAARRLAEKLAQLRATDGEQTEQDFRHALREVVSRCIFGVDRNPMAIELARTALWLEGFEEGRPLGFLDHHLQVGDALLGVTDLKALELGIAKDAFKPLSGDDKEVCKQLAKVNAAALKDLEKKRKARAFGQLDVAGSQDSGLKPLQALEALPENSTQEIAVKEAAYRAFLEQAKTSRLAHAADLLVGAYLLPKREGAGTSIPTSATLYLTLEDVPLPADQQGALAAAQTACAEARVLHWPLAFPQVFASGGFDCVLGNPPWEVMQMGEEEFFATRAPHIAELAGDKRKRAITELPETEPRLWIEYETASQRVAASNNFVRESGRYPLTAVGKLNTYPLFAETISQITHASGRAGFIVPTGIATDDSTKAFFGQITQKGRLISLFDIENRDKLFAAVDSRMKFCLLTLGQAGTAEFVCFAAQVNQLADTRRRFRLTPSEFRLINPNTLTCPVFRSERDAE